MEAGAAQAGSEGTFKISEDGPLGVLALACSWAAAVMLMRPGTYASPKEWGRAARDMFHSPAGDSVSVPRWQLSLLFRRSAQAFPATTPCLPAQAWAPWCSSYLSRGLHGLGREDAAAEAARATAGGCKTPPASTATSLGSANRLQDRSAAGGAASGDWTWAWMEDLGAETSPLETFLASLHMEDFTSLLRQGEDRPGSAHALLGPPTSAASACPWAHPEDPGRRRGRRQAGRPPALEGHRAVSAQPLGRDGKRGLSCV